MARARLAAPLVLVAAALLVGGCGAGGRSSSSQSASSHSQTTPQTRTTTRSRPAPAPRSAPAAPVPAHPGPYTAPHVVNPRTVEVIRRWADALRRGDVRGAARYFEIPSVFAPGPDQEVTIRSLAEATAANTGLPCGAKLISVMGVGGPLVQALFRLTGRPGPGGSSCNPGAGQTARTNFVVRSGRIRVWLRAADQPGDNQGPAPARASGNGGPIV